MTTDNEEPTWPVTFQVAACSVCDALFLMSGRRETSPCHGSDPILVVCTLSVDKEGHVTGEWGVGAPIGVLDITAQPEAPAAPPEPAPAEEALEFPREETVPVIEVLRVVIQAFLDGDPVVEDQLAGVFEDAGAEPEAAATAVGRLQAVRELIQELRGAGVPVTVGATAEEPPPEAPEPPSTPESAPEPS